MNSYELSRKWFDWCFENPDKIRPIHTSIYFFAIEHSNRLGWKQKFGFPSMMVMEALGIKNWRTYSKALNELVDFGFIEILEKSKNQYSANIIAIVFFTKATTKALDKARSKHLPKQGQSIAYINKQDNHITIKQDNERTRAIDFLKNEKEIEYSTFEMQNKKLISNWEKMIDNFNNKIDIEISQNKIEWKTDQIMSRLRMYFSSWLENENNSNSNNKNTQQSKKPNRY